MEHPHHLTDLQEDQNLIVAYNIRKRSYNKMNLIYESYTKPKKHWATYLDFSVCWVHKKQI